MIVDQAKEGVTIVYNIKQGKPSVKEKLNEIKADYLLDTEARVNVIDISIVDGINDTKIKNT